MWEKIANENGLKKLGIGIILIKYPVSGNPVERLDLNDVQNLLRYEVNAINEGIADLRIPEEEIPNPSHILGIGNVTGILNNPPLMHKQIDQIIGDGNWWVEIN